MVGWRDRRARPVRRRTDRQSAVPVVAHRRGTRSTMRASFFSLLRLPATALLAAATLLAGCATPPTDPDELAAFKENNDPLEPMNRYIFEVNNGFDELLIKPVAAWYNLMLPAPVENGV